MTSSKLRSLCTLIQGAVLVGSLVACNDDAKAPHPAQDVNSASDGDEKTDDESDSTSDDPTSASDRGKKEPKLDGGSKAPNVVAPSDAAVVVVTDSSAAPVSAAPAPPTYAIPVPPAPQPKGDAAKGYKYLVHGPYQTLGLPWNGFKATMSKLEPRDSIPDREGDNALVSYQFNVVTDPDGVRVAASNCLSCHASHLFGKVVIGLGHPNMAMLQGQSTGASFDIPGILLRSSPEEAAAAFTYTSRLLNAVQFGAMDVFPVLASHHDPKTLVWQETPVFDGDTALVGGVDTPPWWRCKKKNGLYYTGVGRGEQSRHMSFMSVFSVRNAQEGKSIEDNFVDVEAYIHSLVPPTYPGKIDQALATAGKAVFLKTCATCHGTYGDTDEQDTYPNLVIRHDDVGTDPSLATDNWVNQATVDWFKDSFYAGENRQSWMEQLPGYYAPPLDGVWATAPFFHNGSVPTLDGVIDPKKRPTNWSSAMGDADYDLDRLGWKFNVNGVPGFDTTTPGNSNKGHVYGASLSETDQKALLEYLKTL
ncbi:MAG TPA: hypothetical protein VI299_09665 [Polyangiales bacterium]